MDARTRSPDGEDGTDSRDARKTLAAWLRAGRNRRKLTIDDVAKITKIQPRILEKLENGQLDGLPAEVFVKGFVRSFAKCVGLDESEALDKYAAAQLQPPQLIAVAKALVETMARPLDINAVLEARTHRLGQGTPVEPAPVVEVPVAEIEALPVELAPIEVAPIEVAPIEVAAIEVAPVPMTIEAGGAPVAAAIEPPKKKRSKKNSKQRAKKKKQVEQELAAVAASVEVVPSDLAEVETAVFEKQSIDTAPIAKIDAESLDASIEAKTNDALRVEDGAVAEPSLAAGSQRISQRTIATVEQEIVSEIAASASRAANIAGSMAASEAAAANIASESTIAASETASRATNIASESTIAASETASRATNIASESTIAASETASRATNIASESTIAARETASRATRIASESTIAASMSGVTTAASESTIAANEPADTTTSAASASDANESIDMLTTGTWQPTMPPVATAPSVPWRRPSLRVDMATATAYVVPSLVIDDADPDSADRERDDRTSKEPHRLSFLPPILLDREDRSARQGGLTLAVIILLIAATLTLSYLMRRPSPSGDGVTLNDAPAATLTA